jgi:thiol:disulfide interchange protein
MPAFEAVHQQVGERVALVGINHQDSRDDALALLAETGASYPSGFDPQGDVARAYRLFGMPTTIFITADGRIAGQHTGELSRADLEEAIRDLMTTDTSR